MANKVSIVELQYYSRDDIESKKTEYIKLLSENKNNLNVIMLNLGIIIGELSSNMPIYPEDINVNRDSLTNNCDYFNFLLNCIKPEGECTEYDTIRSKLINFKIMWNDFFYTEDSDGYDEINILSKLDTIKSSLILTSSLFIINVPLLIIFKIEW